MGIIDKLLSKKIEDIYAAVREVNAVSIIHGEGDIYGKDKSGNTILIDVPERRVAADAIKRIEAESGIAPEADETVEDYVTRAAISDVLKDVEELETLRSKAEELGV